MGMKGRSQSAGREWGAARGIALAALTVAGLLVGCGQQGPRVQETSHRPAVSGRVPIVLIPGVGREVARIMRGGSMIPFSALALRTDAEALAHLGDPHFPADGTRPATLSQRMDHELRRTAVRGLQGLIDRLVREEGYVRGDPDDPRDKDYPENSPADREDRAKVASLFVVYYDWRRDLSESACFIAERIARIRALTGAPRILLVGHSLGGLVGRYYLRYGGRDVMGSRDCTLADGAAAAGVNTPGAGAVSRLVALGAPNRGTAQAFRALLQDFRLFGFLPVGLREAVFTMPLAWELLPFPDPDGRVPLLVDNHGEERVPLFALRTWEDQGWLVGDSDEPQRLRFADAMLARAVALQGRMASRNPAEDMVPRLAVAGACRPTLARVILKDGTPEFLTRFQTDHPLFSRATAPGDGVVTEESALGLPSSPTLTSLRVCSAHSAYVDDPDILDRIVRFLLP